MRTSIFAVVLIATSALAATQQVTYDTVYDDGTQSLDTVECAGLATSKIKTFGDFPDFPYIGGAAVVTGYNAPKCGTCWALVYGNATLDVLVIDYAKSGFNIGLKAMNKLTNGNGVALGLVQATVTQVNGTGCGRSP